MGRKIHEFNILPIDLSYAVLDDETKEITAEKSIIISVDDLKSIHNLNKKQKVAFHTIIGKVKANTYVNLDDETKEITTGKSIIVSEDDLKSIHNLNKKQKVAFDTIIGKVKANKSGEFFIDGPGGTRKTFIYRALLAMIRSEGHIALATATSDIAASLLPGGGGRTTYSRFKIPLDLTDGSNCRISKQCSLGILIKTCKLIIWDEAPMANRSEVEALNDLLQDLMDSREIFGGKVVVLVVILYKHCQLFKMVTIKYNRCLFD
ncbi:unnamed protein product [Lactuca saligna]|uniref:ATP-dependent DNA helicase n=1 Tax=Lactuca saligna TaxID=75948 RepID=A0AA36EJV6_LACSI|nr:unnamed protein product [Lactuca saligna]